MKLRLISLAALATVAATAQAGTPLTVAQVQAIPASNTLYIGGSSAAKAIIAGLFTQNCDSTTVVNFKSAKASFASDKSDGESHNVYACTLAAGNDWGLPAGQNAVIYKRERGGSVFGVFPVAKNLPTDFINVATCSDTTKTCTGTVSHTADMGISDEEPSIYNASLNKPAVFDGASTGFGSLSVSNSDFSQVTTVFSQVFGLAVSTPLYTALQTAQGTSGVPTISSTVAATILGGNAFDWSYVGNGSLANNTYQVNICRRDIGSGTQAASNAFFGQYPFNASSGWAAIDGSNTTADIATGAGTGNQVVVENVSTGTVQDCFAAANTAGAYAIGVLGLGAGTTTSYSFVKIDGANPSRDDAKVGNYGFYVESTMQINKATTGAKLSFAKSFIAKSSLASNLNSLGGTAQGGVFALPTSGAGTSDDCTAVAGFPNPVGSSPTATDKFCSRVTRAGSTSNVSQFLQ